MHTKTIISLFVRLLFAMQIFIAGNLKPFSARTPTRPHFETHHYFKRQQFTVASIHCCTGIRTATRTEMYLRVHYTNEFIYVPLQSAKSVTFFVVLLLAFR